MGGVLAPRGAGLELDEDLAGHAEQAARAADLAIAAEPYDEWGHRLRAAALTALGHHHEAVRAAWEAVRLAPLLAVTHRAYAEVAARAPGWRRKALEAGRRAVSLDPHDPACHIALGLAATALWRRRLARRSFQQALALDPADPVAMNNLAITSWWLPSFSRGIANALRMSPDDDVFIENLRVVGSRLLMGLLATAASAFVVAVVVVHLDGPARVSAASVAVFSAFAAIWVLQSWLVVRTLPRGMRLHLVQTIGRDKDHRILVATVALASVLVVLVCLVPGGAGPAFAILGGLCCVASVIGLVPLVDAVNRD